MTITLDAAPFVSVPRIRTKRLLLRELRASDFDAFAANLADPLATQYLSGVVDRRSAWRIFASSTGCWMLHGAGWWGVELEESGELVGSVGAFFRERPGDLELGWTMYRRCWGHGYASEAAAAARDFGFEQLEARRVIAHIDAANVASIRVSQHLGMTYEGDVDLYDTVTGRYALER
jgi:RimJ/RimL family protein N-acetyltransferase